MRGRWLRVGAVCGALTALWLGIPSLAQTQTPPPAPPPPSMEQSPTLAWPPDSAQAPLPNPPAAPAAAPVQAPPVAPPQTPAAAQTANPEATTAQSKAPEKTKTKAKATAHAKKSAKTKSATAQPPAETTAPAAETGAPHEAAPAGGAPVTKTKSAAKSKAAMKSNVARSPRDIVAAIYKVSAGKDGSYSGPSAFDDSKIRHLYFSKDLIAAVAAMQAKSAGAPILNFDPITNSEGPDVQNLNIEVESAQPDHVVVAAKFSSADASSILHYDFVKEGKVWKLDDIRGEFVGQNGQWSLREIIKNNLQRS